MSSSRARQSLSDTVSRVPMEIKTVAKGAASKSPATCAATVNQASWAPGRQALTASGRLRVPAAQSPWSLPACHWAWSLPLGPGPARTPSRLPVSWAGGEHEQLSESDGTGSRETGAMHPIWQPLAGLPSTARGPSIVTCNTKRRKTAYDSTIPFSSFQGFY